MAVLVGISGWNYPGWRGGFYPEGLSVRRMLAYASRRFRAVEINASFYSLQRPSTYRRWYEETPRGFVFAVKGSRYVTHMKRLGDVRVPLANFFASGVLRLEEKLGPVLWQLPPQLRFDPARVAAFLDLLPRSTGEAAALARGHDRRLAGRAWTRVERDRPIRHAFEVRHPSFLVPEFVRLLRRHGAALVFADSAGQWPYAEEVTGGFVYVRLHGSQVLYASRYTDEELDWWAARIRRWAAGGEPPDAVRITHTAPPRRKQRDVYVFFDNDAWGTPRSTRSGWPSG